MSDFKFVGQQDEIHFKTVSKLIRESEGLFQKEGHRHVLFSNIEPEYDSMDGLADQLGINVQEDQLVLVSDYYTTWADYGSRSMIPGLFLFIVDNIGVVRKYKVGGTGNLRDGWGPTAEKTKLQWERPETLTATPLATAQPEPEVTDDRPEITEGRQVLVGTIRSVRVDDGFYGRQVKMTVVLDDGNIVFGTMPAGLSTDRDLVDTATGHVYGTTNDMADKGDYVQFTATVTRGKDDNHFGIIKRPSKAKVLKAAITEQEEVA